MTPTETVRIVDDIMASFAAPPCSAPREHNRVSPEGKKMGEQMARLCDRESKKFIAEGEWTEDERCASCAFRLGTVPNGCLQTQLDVMKAVMEHEAFFCHMVDTPGTKVCAGWFASVQAVKHKPKVICPWPYSPPDDETQEQNAGHELRRERE